MATGTIPLQDGSYGVDEDGHVCTIVEQLYPNDLNDRFANMLQPIAKKGVRKNNTVATKIESNNVGFAGVCVNSEHKLDLKGRNQFNQPDHDKIQAVKKTRVHLHCIS